MPLSQTNYLRVYPVRFYVEGNVLPLWHSIRGTSRPLKSFGPHISTQVVFAYTHQDIESGIASISHISTSNKHRRNEQTQQRHHQPDRRIYPPRRRLVMAAWSLQASLHRLCEHLEAMEGGVQRRIFSNVELKDEWIGPFACVFAIPQRRALLRQLHFFIRLPTYSEGRDDHDANTAAFGHAIHRLFAHLVTDPETVFG